MTNRWTTTDDVTLEAIASLLKRGGVVLLPTDTIYGLHASAANERALARLRKIKGRDADKPFVILAASVEQLRDLGAVVPNVLRTIWPAPVTAVLPRRGGSIAARIPELAWLRDLLERSGPLASTSANRSGEPPVGSPDELAPDMQESLVGILDLGRIDGKPSVIVDFTETQPRVIREGEALFTQKLRKTLRKSL